MLAECDVVIGGCVDDLRLHGLSQAQHSHSGCARRNRVDVQVVEDREDFLTHCRKSIAKLLKE